ncbi:MAG: hypothetical protein V3U88_13005 [Methylococcales bacterium]
MKKTTFCILTIAMLFGTQIIAAPLTIEKWIDDEGKYHFSQRPVETKVQLKQASSAKKSKKKKNSEARKTPKVYKKRQTKHKNPKNYSQKDH